jgi:hypothetical protein
MINPDGSYRHMKALRDVITAGATGEDIAPTTQGSLVTRTITYTVPATIGTIPVDLSNLELIGFVAESASNIINVARFPITYTGLSTTNNANVVSISQIEPLCVNTVAPKFQLKNMGGAPITTAEISYSINGGTPATYTYSGNINPLGTVDVTLPALSFTLNPSNTINITVTSVNGTNDDDPSNNSGSSTFTATTSESQTVNVILRLNQDRYGQEITWKFFDAAGNQIAAGGPYAQLAANGTLLHIHNVTVPATGCYRFVLYDSYGDGINSGYGAGNATILDGYYNLVYFTNGVFATQAARNFDVTGNVNNTGLQENQFANSLNIYPNPVNASSATFDFTLTETNSVSLVVRNAIGQTLSVQNLGKMTAGNHSATIDVSGLAGGLYFIDLNVGNTVITNKFSVIK